MVRRWWAACWRLTSKAAKRPCNGKPMSLSRKQVYTPARRFTLFRICGRKKPAFHPPPDRFRRKPYGDVQRAVYESDSVCQVAMQRSEEHTSELKSHMRISYAVFC